MLRYMPKLNQSLRPLLIKKKAEKELHASDTKDFKAMLYYIDAKINKTRVFVPSTILKVWKNFVTEWKSEGCPKLFYFRTDIRDAYPSVSISKLKEILLDAGGEKGHRMVLKKFKVITAGGRTMDRESIFDDHCKNNWHSGIHSRPCLVMDKEQDRVDNAWKILERAIRVLSKSNDVKLGRRFYKFSHGLPQGWGPSSLLCSIYYGYIDSKMYLPFIESPGRFFLRIVDDYRKPPSAGCVGIRASKPNLNKLGICRCKQGWLSTKTRRCVQKMKIG
ncbi:Telomerase reverse transcriptase [Orchesella cincta]|uniref:Telomerase reverse transcriptase n=1 Tax=Orchesella cincta TaxID=48709 RepID=A0A1D2MEX2_ORCCI|nr:Telomerase reverse transcriptase [Orchesella cincta]